MRKFAQAGFTLVELLIVVIILAILAAIVIPQFSSSTTDAQEAALDSNLAALRSAVELYRVQHANVFPGGTASSGGACATKGTGAINTAQAWVDHLLLASDVNGNTCGLSDTVTFRFGPYLRKGVPAEPITNLGGNVIGTAATGIVVTSTGAALAPGAATGGWAVDTRSGQIVMNSNANDSRGRAYSTH